MIMTKREACALLKCYGIYRELTQDQADTLISALQQAHQEGYETGHRIGHDQGYEEGYADAAAHS